MKRRILHAGPNDDSSEYKNSLSDKDKEFIERFDSEFHNGQDSGLLKGEAKQEAWRNRNALYRDLYNVARNSGVLSQLDELTERFLEDASDEWDWRNRYHTNGFSAAAEMIIDQTVNNLKNPNLSVRIMLYRFFEQLTSLMREYNYDRNQKRKNQK
jgi:hypothetical protein